MAEGIRGTEKENIKLILGGPEPSLNAVLRFGGKEGDPGLCNLATLTLLSKDPMGTWGQSWD